MSVIISGINGANSSCNCWPPDPSVAAGPQNVVELVNTAMEIISRTGAVISTTPLSTFFSSLSPASLSEPEVLYDEAAGRWYIGAVDFTNASSDSFDFAVSNNSDATQGFTVHKFAVDEGSSFAVFPRMGVNADAIFVSFNMFTTSNYLHPQILTIQKSTVLNGTSSSFSSFHHDQNSSLYTLDPANMHGAAAGGPEYFVTEGATAGTVDIIKETNVLSNTPTDTDNNITVASYVQTLPAIPQPSGTVAINGGTEMLNAAWRNNILVATQTVATGSPQEAHARWYQFTTSSTPSLTQYGEINPGSGVATYAPSIDIDTADDIGMTFMLSSSSPSNGYISMGVTVRTLVDPSGTMEQAAIVKMGATNYPGSPGPTYVDHCSGTSVDPTTGAFWLANEFIDQNTTAPNLWATCVASFLMPNISNQPPVANDASVTVNENSQTMINLAGFVTDVENDPFTCGLFTAPSHGTSSLSGNVLTYTPTAGFFGTDTFTYQAQDVGGLSNTATVTIRVVNQPPVAHNASYQVNENSPLTVSTANGVLANATDPEHDPLTATLVQAPAHGVLSLNADGSFSYSPVAGFVGTDTFTYQAQDVGGLSNVATVNIAVKLHLLVVAPGLGNAPEVKVYDAATGALRLDFNAYEPSFLGGVRVAVADINGDGVPDIITAPGGVNVSLVNVNGALLPSFDLSAGRTPEIKVFSGIDGGVLVDFLAYTSTFRAGLFVAVGNVDGTGKPDIIAAPDATGQPGHTQVSVFFNNHLINTGVSLTPDCQFNAYDPGFGGGVRVAVADFNGDGFADIVTAPGIWSGPDIRVFDGKTLANNSIASKIGEFLAYDFRYFGGVFVATGDVNGDRLPDIVTGTNGNGGPEVKAFSGTNVLTSPTPTVLEDFFAYDPAFNGGARVAVVDIDGDGSADIITGAGPGGGPHVRIFNGATGLQLQNAQDSFFAFAPDFSGGVFVGAG
jgi:hypothetical protein